jgi:hypothetical protein
LKGLPTELKYGNPPGAIACGTAENENVSATSRAERPMAGGEPQLALVGIHYIMANSQGSLAHSATLMASSIRSLASEQL